MKKFYVAFVFLFFFSFAHAQEAFITTWQVTGDDLSITIPTDDDNYSYDYTVDFGDGTVENNVSGDISHTYPEEGTYTVSISGDFPKIYFLGGSIHNRELIKTVEQWGDIEWQSMEHAFYNCENLVGNATDTPNLNQVTDMSSIFRDCENFNSDISNWDVSNITNMEFAFNGATLFNQPLNNWDVSNVTNMTGLFTGTNFNQALDEWDVSSVTSMASMFGDITSFNQPLNNWNVSNVIDMSYMFSGAKSFNQPLDNWNVSNVNYMSSMFKNTYMFNQSLNNWDVSSVTNMNYMFNQTASFNKPLNIWDVSNVTTMKDMFGDASEFNQPLNNWDVSNVTDMWLMFENAKFFNQDISNWNFNDNVELIGFLDNSGLDLTHYDALLLHFENLNIEGLTMGADNLAYCDEGIRDILINDRGWSIEGDYLLFNCDTSIPDGAFVSRWKFPFENTEITIPTEGEGYNYTIDFGDGTVESNVTGDITHTYSSKGVYRVIITGEFPRIFFNNNSIAYTFWTIEQWGDMQWQSMRKAFAGCGDLIIHASDNPDLSQVTDMSYMFENDVHFNSHIENWDVSNVTNMKGLFSVSFSDFNEPLNNWNVSNVTDMSHMFENCTHFNRRLDSWDVSNVTTMENMFAGTIKFNQPLNNWDVSQVNTMKYMFNFSKSFNQALNNWDVSNVTNMDNMFRQAYAFNKPIDNWDVSNVTNMESMFQDATSFNQALNNWDVSNASLGRMFYGGESFNQDLSNWQISTANLSEFLSYSNLDVNNYDAFLSQLASLNISDGSLGAQVLKYCDQSVHDYLENTLGWTITGDSQSPNCNSITGNIRYDQDNNGCDENDLGVTGFMVNANDGTNDFKTFSNNGDYTLGTLGNSFTVSVINYPDYYTVSPESVEVNFDDGNNEAQQDFCLTATQTVADLNVAILPINQARPGFAAQYQVVVENMGTQSVSNAQVVFGFDDAVQTFDSATPNPVSTTANTLDFELDALPPFATQTLELTLQTATPPTVNGNDILNLTAAVTPDANDNTPEDNTFAFDQDVVNSFDPNDKQVVQGDEVSIDDADQYLDYIIRFQNTGTASAVNVRVVDTLNPKLDYSTISPVSASDAYRVEITDDNHVEFIFDDINLPYEGEDEAGSHGFIAYKIKPKANVEVGDVITGDASIYFDFNEPIITNTVSTTIVEELETETHQLLKNQVVLYPNPAKDIVNIKTSETIQIENVTLYNLQGQKVKSFQNHLKAINIGNLEAGLYFVNIKTNKGSLNRQVVKE